MNKKSIILYSLLVVTLACFFAVFYFSIRTKDKYDFLSNAKLQIAEGNYTKASELLRAAIAEDLSFEEAFVLLVNLEESRDNYDDAIYLWATLCDLNKLNADYSKRLYEAILTSQNHDYFIAKYKNDFVNNSADDEKMFYLAMSYLKRNNNADAVKIQKELKKKSSIYAEILQGYILQKSGNFKDSLKCFSSAPNQNQNAMLGKVISYIALDEVQQAKKLLNEIKPEKHQKGLLEICKWQVAILENKREEGLAHLLTAAKIMQSNFELSLQAIELAYALKDEKSFSTFQNGLNISNKEKMFLGNYASAFRAALKGEYKTALISIKASGDFSNRVAAEFLAIRCAFELNDFDEFIFAFEKLNENTIPKKVKVAIAKDIESMIAKNISDVKKSQKLAELLLRYDENNLSAMKLLINTNADLNNGDFLNRLIKANPSDDNIFLRYCRYCFDKKYFHDVIEICEKRLKLNAKDPRTMLVAAQAFQNLRENNKAIKFYKKALATSEYNISIAEIAGIAFLNMGAIEPLKELVESLSLKSAPEKSLAHTLNAEFNSLNGNFAEAEKQIEEAIKFAPETENLYTMLAEIKFKTKGAKAAANTLKTASEKFPNDENFKFKYALTLAKTSDKNDWAQSKEILSSLLKKAPSSLPLLLNYSALLAQMGDSQNALKYALLALENHPDSTDANFYLGMRYFETGLYAQSIDKISIAKLKSNRKEIGEYLKKAYIKAIENAAKKEEKREYILRYKMNFPTDTSYDKMLKSITNEKN